MSSLKMHIAISEQIREKFSFGDEFLLGAILPDIYKIKLKEGNLRKTHFEIEKYIPDINKFCEEYKNKKSEIVYGYLAHLVQDKIWFDEYVRKYAKDLKDGNYRYAKDNTTHTEKEFFDKLYIDYSIIDKYIINKCDLNIEEIKENIKKVEKNEEIIKIIDKTIIDYKYDVNDGITFFDIKDADEYFKKAVLETEKVLKNFMKN